MIALLSIIASDYGCLVQALIQIVETLAESSICTDYVQKIA
jgi:hypothetical protein